MFKRLAALACAIALWSMSNIVTAADISIGLAADLTSMDPHYHNFGPNSNLADHVFQPLVIQDEHQRLKPGLAESWRVVNDTTWEFKLRKGVKFHDGSNFTAEDVVFSINRSADVPNSPSSFSMFTKPITEKIIVDPYTLRLKTATPYPLLAADLSNIRIISKKIATGATTEDFNSGKAMIGTGPFKFVKWTRGDRVELVRNNNYWGKKAPWEKVTFRILPNDPTRLAALLAGDVQAIEKAPPADIASLKSNPDLKVFTIVSNRVIYLHMDTDRDKSPFITDKAGNLLEKNPLKDLRVRQAISKAINRIEISSSVMQGLSIPAGQFLADSFFGASPKLKAEPYDLEGAKKLLAAAGYPNGFGITLHGTNNRYVNDRLILQTIAQMLAKVGIDVKVDSMPSNIFFSRANKLEFSFLMAGWGSDTGETSSSIKALLATYNKDKGMGTSNNGRYSNPKMDQVLEEALATVDDSKREKLLQQTAEIGIGDLGLIPLHFQVNAWVTRNGIAYTPRTDEHTWAHEFRPTR